MGVIVCCMQEKRNIHKQCQQTKPVVDYLALQSLRWV